MVLHFFFGVFFFVWFLLLFEAYYVGKPLQRPQGARAPVLLFRFFSVCGSLSAIQDPQKVQLKRKRNKKKVKDSTFESSFIF